MNPLLDEQEKLSEYRIAGKSPLCLAAALFCDLLFFRRLLLCLEGGIGIDQSFNHLFFNIDVKA